MTRRTCPGVLWSAFALTLTALAALTLGEYRLGWTEITGGGDPVARFILFELRLPRVLAGAFAGACLGLAGALFQSITRNPLASPDFIGLNAGAALGAVLMLALVTEAPEWAVMLGAMAGGLIVALLVLAASWSGGLRPQTLVLTGLGIGFTAFAGVDFLLTRANLAEATGIVHWLTGSLSARDMGHVRIGALGLGICALPLLALQARLITLELGDDAATGLGLRVMGLRGGAAALGVGLVGVAISVAGPVAFVAFVAGPIARRIAARPGPNLGLAALIGALILLVADLTGRLLFAPTELPAGVFTALLGAPYLIWLLWRQIQTGDL